MASKNAVSLIGYLGADPEIRYMPNGDPVAQVSVGTTEAWKDRGSGELKERTEWHRVIVYGKNVVEKYIQPYAKKGSAVAVDGRLRTRKIGTQPRSSRPTSSCSTASRPTVSRRRRRASRRTTCRSDGTRFADSRAPLPRGFLTFAFYIRP